MPFRRGWIRGNSAWRFLKWLWRRCARVHSYSLRFGPWYCSAMGRFSAARELCFGCWSRFGRAFNVRFDWGGAISVCAIDASANMVAAFRRHFPDINITCEPVEQSTFFGRSFDAVMAVGVIFLLPTKTQIEVISQISGALKSGGRFLFSAPIETGNWNDLLTGRPSTSLGIEAYKSALSECGLHLVNTYNDEGGSHYYDAQKAT